MKNTTVRHWSYPALLMVMMLSLAACSSLPSSQTLLNDQDVIHVSGVGRARGEPDLATLSVGVNIANENISAAVDESNQTIEDITEALQGLGVEANDIHTTNFSIWAEEQWDPQTGQRLPERLFRVDSTVQITVRQVDSIGEILEASIQSGANNIHGLTFGIEDTSELAEEARRAALDEAERKAEAIADELGVELDRVISVSDATGGMVTPFFESAARGLGGGGGEPPISEGTMTVSVTVNMTYAIQR